jgi:hypothetical protein
LNPERYFISNTFYPGQACDLTMTSDAFCIKAVFTGIGVFFYISEICTQ